MEKEIYLYPYSAAEARTRNELALWRASYQANEECARDIEEHIRTHFDGAHLDDSMLQPLLDKWGYKRINFVLANTLQELRYDGRFSRKNQEWAKATFIPQDGTHNISLMVNGTAANVSMPPPPCTIHPLGYKVNATRFFKRSSKSFAG